MQLSTMKNFTFLISIFLVFALVNYCLADDSTLKQFFSQTGDSITKYGEEAYGKVKKTAQDAASSVKETFNKGIDKINESIKPKDTLDQIKKIIPGTN